MILAVRSSFHSRKNPLCIFLPFSFSKHRPFQKAKVSKNIFIVPSSILKSRGVQHESLKYICAA